MKVVIISFFKSSNIGDCILSNCLYDLFEADNKCEKVSYSLNPFEYADINSLQRIESNPGASIKTRIITILNRIGCHRIMEAYYWRKKYLTNSDYRKVEALIMESDFVVIGGGNMVFDLSDGSLSAGRLHFYIELCKKNNKPVIVSSIGMGPFSNSNQLTKAVLSLKDANYISFRDRKSYETYAQFGGENCHLSTDPAYTLGKSSLIRAKQYVSINIINPAVFLDSLEEIDSVKARYIELVQAVQNRGFDIRIFTTDIRDYDFAKMNIAEKFDIPIVSAASISELLKLYSQTTLVIGTRMHSMIIALTQGIPIIGLKWQEKVGELFSYLELDEYCHAIMRVRPEMILDQVEGICNGNSTQSERYIHDIVEKQKHILYHDKEHAIEAVLGRESTR